MIEALRQAPCDVFNHNLETVPRLYKQSRPGADYRSSLQLLKDYKQAHPSTPTKSGLMLGIGENTQEIHQELPNLMDHDGSMLTLGQYLQPSKEHLPVQRYITPDEFAEYALIAEQLGFEQVASAPLVRSSYHADAQAESALLTAG